VHQVGAGVLGPVFRGYDPEHDRAVAIKAFCLDLTPEQARELAASLGRLPALPLKHSSIIALYAAGAEGSTAYLVQEYFVAESADVALKQYGPAPVPDAMRLIGQLAGALDFAAGEGVHHGALHPRDILVAPHEVRLSGLGVVEALEGVGYRPPTRRPYAAPERAAGVPVGCQADVFSLAGVSYELLTGRRPVLSGDAIAIETEPIPAASAVALAEVFSRALSPRPEDRFASALAFAASLKHALTGEPLLAGETVDRPKTRRAPRAASRKDAAEPRPAAPADLLAEVPAGAPEAAAVPAAADAGLPRSAVEPEPLPATPPPGSTPLPSFLEAYRPVVEEGPAAPEPPVVPASLSPRGGTNGTAAQPAVADEPVLASEARPELDLADLDRRIEMTTAIPVVRPAAAPPDEPPAVPSFEPFDRRVETTQDARTEDDAPAEAAPAGDEPPPPAFGLEEPERKDHPQRELPMFGSEPPVVSSGEQRLRNRWVSHVGMLLVGLLIGLVIGRYVVVAPVGAPGPAAPAVTGAPAAAAAASTSAPPGAAPAAEPLPEASAPPPLAKPIEAATAKPAEDAAAKAAAPVAAKPAAPVAAKSVGTTPAKPAKTDVTRTAAAPGTKAASGAKATSRAKFEGSLVVASKPAGATVRLDGRAVGTTPVTLQAVPAGAHAVRLELSGYEVWSSSVQVTAGKVNRVTASLERRPGG
jgi:serine/threonine protein kinase